MAKTTKYLQDRDNRKIVAEAVTQLRGGQLVAIPTETVYGLAADATNPRAVGEIYRVKGRPSTNPLICHVCSAAMAEKYVTISETARQLMDNFWPGSLTLVLPLRPDAGIAPMVTAGLSTLAVRCPAHEAAHAIISGLDRPIAAPSANPSGKLSPVTAQDVEAGLGDKIPLIIDGGRTEVGIESTIVAVNATGITLLRPGTITIEEITAATGLDVAARKGDTITAPGQLSSHYAPASDVHLNVTAPAEGTVFIGFGPLYSSDQTLSPSGDLAEAAANLFTRLREADRLAEGRPISVAPIPNQGIGIAINDRLNRAAAPRDA